MSLKVASTFSNSFIPMALRLWCMLQDSFSSDTQLPRGPCGPSSPEKDRGVEEAKEWCEVRVCEVQSTEASRMWQKKVLCMGKTFDVCVLVEMRVEGSRKLQEFSKGEGSCLHVENNYLKNIDFKLLPLESTTTWLSPRRKCDLGYQMFSLKRNNMKMLTILE